MDIFSDSTEFTENVGRAIGAWAKPKTVIRLNGGLGMGKTVIAKGIARGLGIEEPITSPSYSIIQEYPGQPGLIHIDLYRINDED